MNPRRKYRLIGTHREQTAAPIELPFTITNLVSLLADGANPNGCHTHQQIKDWADRFWWVRYEQPLYEDVPSGLKAIAHLAQNVEMQWDMYLANTFTLVELNALDFSQVRLPGAWFAEWLDTLRQLAQTTDAE